MYQKQSHLLHGHLLSSLIHQLRGVLEALPELLLLTEYKSESRNVKKKEDCSIVRDSDKAENEHVPVFHVLIDAFVSERLSSSGQNRDLC